MQIVDHRMIPITASEVFSVEKHTTRERVKKID
jgi:hypothetical protein